MSVEAFTVSVVDTGDDALVVVTGTLDAATCPTLAGALASLETDSRSDVVVDLSGVELLDSSALDLFTGVSLGLLATGRRFGVSNPSPVVRRLLSLADLQMWRSPHDERDQQ